MTCLNRNTLRNTLLLSSIILISKTWSADALEELVKKYPSSQSPKETDTPTAPKEKKKKKSHATSKVSHQLPSPQEEKKISSEPNQNVKTEVTKIDEIKTPTNDATIVTKKTEEVKKVEPEAPIPDKIFGSMWGYREHLSKNGFDFEVTYKGDLTRNLAGGLERKNDYLGDLDVKTTFDFDRMLGVKGLSLNVYGLGTHGDKPSEMVGDKLGTSNIEAPSTFRFFETYLKQIIDERFTLTLGFKDLNADYYSTASSGLFRNGSFGLSPTLALTGVHGPSIYPNAALSLTTKYESPSSFYFQSGVFNAKGGDPQKLYGTHFTTRPDEDYLMIWETGLAKSNDTTAFKYAVGAWTYSKEQTTSDPNGGAAHNGGAYFLADQKMSEHIAGFFKQGFSSSKINQFMSGTELGMTYSALLPNRPNDIAGIAFAYARVAKDYKTANDSTDSESVIELSYRTPLARGIYLTPDYQYVMNPSATKGLKNASVASVRIELSI